MFIAAAVGVAAAITNSACCPASAAPAVGSATQLSHGAEDVVPEASEL